MLNLLFEDLLTAVSHTVGQTMERNGIVPTGTITSLTAQDIKHSQNPVLMAMLPTVEAKAKKPKKAKKNEVPSTHIPENGPKSYIDLTLNENGVYE